LTLLYGALFLLCGAAVLAVAYLFAAHAISVAVPGNKPGPAAAANAAGRIRVVSGVSHVVHLTPAQAAAMLAQATTQHSRAIHELLIGSGLTLAGMSVLSLALGWLLAGRVLQPLRKINDAARRIGASNLHERLRLDGPDDEFRELGATLDDLFARLQSAFESQRRFVANASHELRTPLTLDRALLERALRKQQPPQELWRATCERLLASNQDQDDLIDALLMLARSESTLERPEPAELAGIVDGVLRSPELDVDKLGLQIRTEIEPAPTFGDPRLIERLIRNLVDNAINHNIPGGDVMVSTALRGGRAVLTVTNTGPRVPAHEVQRLLQPFQRLGADRTVNGDGHGLGLSIVQAIAIAHQADLVPSPRPDGGLSVEVCFPPS
jgi:signal transduction histidine kinase